MPSGSQRLQGEFPDPLLNTAAVQATGEIGQRLPDGLFHRPLADRSVAFSLDSEQHTFSKPPRTMMVDDVFLKHQVPLIRAYQPSTFFRERKTDTDNPRSV